MGSGCDSPGGGQRSNRSLGSLLCHCNGSWNISPKRLRTPRHLSTDDELTAMRNYRWSILKTHTQFPHLHTSICKWLIIDITDINFMSSFLSFLSHTHTSVRMLMIDCSLWLTLASSLLLFIRPFAAALGLSPSHIKLFFKCILTTDVKMQSG